MNILLIRTWKTNIGNAIIEKGAKALVKEAFPSARIIESSLYPNYIDSRLDSINSDILSSIFDELKNYVSKTKYLSSVAGPVYNHLFHANDNTTQYHDWTHRWRITDKKLDNVIQLIDQIDLAVLPGCVLGGGLEIVSSTLDHLHDNDVPLILLGVGGGTYDESMQKYVLSKLREIDVAGIITRDSTAFNAYSDVSDYSYNGIDCGLWISDWYTPPVASEKIIAATFDKTSQHTIDTDSTIIRLNHAPFRNPGIGFSNRFGAISAQNFYEAITPDFFRQDNTIISDILEDYLFVYANAERVISDRIHACVPALAYGNDAEFKYNTPRDGLFDNLRKKGVIENTGTEDRMTTNRTVLESEKRKQANKFSEMVSNIT